MKHKSDQAGNSIGWDSDTLNTLIFIACLYSKGSNEMSHFYSDISLQGEPRSMLRLLLPKGAATILLRLT